MRSGSARRARVGVIQMRSVRRAVAGHGERDIGQFGIDLLRGGKQDPRAGGAGLHDGRPADVAEAGHSGEPGHAVERMLLRDADPHHAVIDRLDRDAPFSEFRLGHVSGKLDRVQIGERPLPARERRAPVGAIGDFGFVTHGFHHHFLGVSASRRMRLASRRCARIAPLAPAPSAAASAAAIRFNPFNTTVRTSRLPRVRARR